MSSQRVIFWKKTTTHVQLTITTHWKFIPFCFSHFRQVHGLKISSYRYTLLFNLMPYSHPSIPPTSARKTKASSQGASCVHCSSKHSHRKPLYSWSFSHMRHADIIKEKPQPCSLINCVCVCVCAFVCACVYKGAVSIWLTAACCSNL